MDVVTRVICKPWKEGKTDVQWGTEPSTIVPGVHVSMTLITRDRLCDVPVRVINVLSGPSVVNAGATVADLQLVEVISLLPAQARPSTDKVDVNTITGMDSPGGVIDEAPELI